MKIRRRISLKSPNIFLDAGLYVEEDADLPQTFGNVEILPAENEGGGVEAKSLAKMETLKFDGEEIPLKIFFDFRLFEQLSRLDDANIIRRRWKPNQLEYNLEIGSPAE